MNACGLQPLPTKEIMWEQLRISRVSEFVCMSHAIGLLQGNSAMKWYQLAYVVGSVVDNEGYGLICDM